MKIEKRTKIASYHRQRWSIWQNNCNFDWYWNCHGLLPLQNNCAFGRKVCCSAKAYRTWTLHFVRFVEHWYISKAKTVGGVRVRVRVVPCFIVQRANRFENGLFDIVELYVAAIASLFLSLSGNSTGAIRACCHRRWINIFFRFFFNLILLILSARFGCSIRFGVTRTGKSA